MKWHTETAGDWILRMKRWHKWFAWYPVFSFEDRTTYWLVDVERKLETYTYYFGSADWEYRGIK